MLSTTPNYHHLEMNFSVACLGFVCGGRANEKLRFRLKIKNSFHKEHQIPQQVFTILYFYLDQFEL